MQCCVEQLDQVQLQLTDGLLKFYVDSLFWGEGPRGFNPLNFLIWHTVQVINLNMHFWGFSLTNFPLEKSWIHTKAGSLHIHTHTKAKDCKNVFLDN